MTCDYSEFDLSPEALKGSYSGIVDVVGAEAAIKMSENFRGRNIWIAKNYKDTEVFTEFSDVIGEKKAEKLMKAFSKDFLYFSDFKFALSEQIAARVEREFNGYNYGELCRKYGYSERKLRNIIENSRKNGKKKETKK